MLNVYIAEYTAFDGSKEDLVRQIGDGSIIKRFDMTPFPSRESDIVCPHFLELKWATGCPFDCAWCYLRGTMRHYSRRKKPTYKDSGKVVSHVRRLFRVDYPRHKEVLNTGELADSLMSEHTNAPFSKFIVPIFEMQTKHKILFLTKGHKVDNLLSLNPHDQVIVSFSLNSEVVADKWEKAPPVIRRIEAARKVFKAGYETRVRIDPIVPYPEDNWARHYHNLIDNIFSNLRPARITLGSLRGLQSTINQANDRSWIDYLKEPSEWGKRIPYEVRWCMFKNILDYLEQNYDYTDIAFCKEPIRMWRELGLDWKRCKCNCVW